MPLFRNNSAFKTCFNVILVTTAVAVADPSVTLPATPRLPRIQRADIVAPPIDTPFIQDSSITVKNPERPRLFTAPRFQEPTWDHSAQFSPEMAQGAAPDRARTYLNFRRQYPEPVASIDVGATLQLESAVYAPSRPFQPKLQREGFVFRPIDTTPPDTSYVLTINDVPRLKKALQTPLPVVIDIVAPDTSYNLTVSNRPLVKKPLQIPPSPVIDVAVVQLEAAVDAPSQPFQFRLDHSGSVARPIDVTPPDTSYALAITDRPRLGKPTQFNQAGTIDVSIFSIEMTQATRPDRARIFLAPRIALPVSQTTHVPAPFSPEMVIGSHPDRNRQFLAPRLSISPGLTETIKPGPPGGGSEDNKVRVGIVRSAYLDDNPSVGGQF